MKVPAVSRNILIALILFLLPAAATAGQDAQRAPDLRLKDLQEHTVQLSDYRGKVILINFWATWCAPCRAEIPDLVKLQKDYEDSGLQIIGINFPPEEGRDVREFTRNLKVNYPVLIGTGDVAASFDAGSGMLPITIIVDREGIIRDHIEGVFKPEDFEKKVKPLLQHRAE